MQLNKCLFHGCYSHFPAVTPSPLLLCVCMCVWWVYFHAFVRLRIVGLYGSKCTCRGFVALSCTYRCVISSVWSTKRLTMPQMTDTLWAEVKGLCSCRTVRTPTLPYRGSSYHNRYRSDPPPPFPIRTASIYSRTYRWAGGGGVLGISLTPSWDFFFLSR